MSKAKRDKDARPVPSEAELERKHLRFLAVVQALKTVLVVALIGCFAWLIVHSMFYLPIQAAHGEATTINVVQTWLANVNASVYIAWGAATAGAAYGISERRKRNRERSEKDARLAKLERQIDPHRLSSGLTPGGETVPEN